MMPAPRRVTDVQMSLLLNFFETHTHLVNVTQLGGGQDKHNFDLLWKDLTSQMNAVRGGYYKTPKEWRHYWSDQKCKVRKKALSYKSGRANILSPYEDRILGLIEKNAMEMKSVPVQGNMGLYDTNVASPSTVSQPEPSTSKEESVWFPSNAEMDPLSPSQQHSSKRKHVACNTDDSDPVIKSMPHDDPPQWALELEERRAREEGIRRKLEQGRLSLEELRLEQDRTFRRSMMALEEQRFEEQRIFHRKLLSILGNLCKSLTPPSNQD